MTGPATGRRAMTDGVVVVLSGFPRRSETFALGELGALARAGVLRAAFAIKPGDGLPPHPEAARLAPLVTALPPGDVAVQAAAIARALGGRRPSAVHGYFAHTPAAVAEAAARHLDAPFGFSVHARDGRKVAADTLRERGRRAAAVVTCNTDMHGWLETLGVAAQLVPHGVDLDRFPCRPLAIVPPVRLLAVGRLVPKKGFHVLIRALAAVRTPVALSVVGDGPERPRLTALAQTLGVADRVTWHGSATHETLPAAYHAAHAVVVPSVEDDTGDRDGLPNVVLEALATGRLVVASRLGALGTALRDDDTALLVPAGDASALAARLDGIVREPAHALRVAAAGRVHVERHYEAQACGRRFVDVLAERYV